MPSGAFADEEGLRGSEAAGLASCAPPTSRTPLLRSTARTRATKGDTWCLDPFGVSGRPAARYNPLAWLDATNPDLAEDAQTIADALVHDAPGQSGEAHWNEEA